MTQLPSNEQTPTTVNQTVNPVEQQVTGDTTGGVIPYKNPMALAAYYCAIFSLIPGVGLLLGPIGFGLGIKGFMDYRAEPKRAGHIHAWIGIILGGLIGAVHVVAILAMIIAAAS